MNTTPIRPGVLLAAAWLALMTGLLEAGILTVRRFALGQMIGLSEHYAWMAPAGYLLVLLPFALAAAAGRRLLPRLLTYERVVGLLVFLCALGVLFMFPRIHRVAMIALAAGVALQVTRVLYHRSAAFARSVATSLPWLGGLVVGIAAVIFASQWHAERRALAALPAARADAPNVILIILDTVRSTSMSLFGYVRPTTPELERLARGGVVFERAVSPSPWTLPAHGALFTGRYPHEQTSNWKTPLDDRDATLAEVLGAAGYVTGGFAANPFYTMREHGLDRGFAHYEGFPVSIGQVLNSASLASLILAGRPGYSRNKLRDVIGNYEYLGRKKADDVTSSFLAWQARQGDRPFFAFLNYIDAYDPYTPPAVYAEAFGVHDPRTMWQRVTGRVPGMTAEARHRLWWNPDAYDATIAFMDAELGRMFRALDQQGVLENTLVIVTSDHGEQFGEHGLYGHGNSLYMPLLHVPLVVHFPGVVPAGRRIAEFVTIRSLPATVLDLTGVAGSGMPGTSLAALWRDGEAAVDPLVFEVRQGINVDPDVPIAVGDMYGVIAEGHYLIRNGDGSEELYDVRQDMALQHNLIADTLAGTTLRRLRAHLGRLVGGAAEHAAGTP
jgi:arylsulfatase A-like enzyme